MVALNSAPADAERLSARRSSRSVRSWYREEKERRRRDLSGGSRPPERLRSFLLLTISCGSCENLLSLGSSRPCPDSAEARSPVPTPPALTFSRATCSVNLCDSIKRTRIYYSVVWLLASLVSGDVIGLLAQGESQRHGDYFTLRDRFVLIERRNNHERALGVGLMDGATTVSERVLGKSLRIAARLRALGPGRCRR